MLCRHLAALLAGRFYVWTQLARKYGLTLNTVVPAFGNHTFSANLARQASDFAK